MAEEKVIEMYVAGLLLDPNTKTPVVVLKNETDDIHLPIWIGMAEATSIGSAIKNLKTGRPLTHDLMQDIFFKVGLELRRVIVNDLKDATYFAEIILSMGDEAFVLDARPSDAIALAVRSECPVFVHERVIEKAQIAFSKNLQESGKVESLSEETAEVLAGEEESMDQSSVDFTEIDKDKWNELLEDLNIEDFKWEC